MERQQVEWLCAAYALGAPLADLAPVSGGLQHHMWRLVTTTGTFAVKELNPASVRQPEMRHTYRLTERIAAAVQRAGLPAVPALVGRPRAGRVQDVGDATVLVYPWIDGQALPMGPAAPEQARQIGDILGRIHTLRLNPDALSALAWVPGTFRDDDWVLPARQAAALGLPWADPLRAAVRDLALTNARYRRALPGLYRHRVVSHRDLAPQNVLWRAPRTPAIVDWEAAGVTNPTVELADVALKWSGLPSGEPDATSFAAVLAGYRAAGALPPDEPRDALYAVLANWLAWLRLNLRRSLGDGIVDSAEQEQGTRAATQTLAILQRLASGLDLYASWMAATE